MIQNVFRAFETVHVSYDSESRDVTGWLRVPAHLVDEILRGSTRATTESGDLQLSLVPEGEPLELRWVLRVYIPGMVSLSLKLDSDPRKQLAGTSEVVAHDD